MSLLLPSIIRRIDDYLLVKEINAKLFDNWLHEKAVLIAITAPSAAAEFDYERQELLGWLLYPSNSLILTDPKPPIGDAYLKYLSSIYLFVTYPTQQEGAMHVARQRIISNRSLLQRARESDVPQYIQSKPFTTRTWVPYNFKIVKKVREPDGTEATTSVGDGVSGDSKDGTGEEHIENTGSGDGAPDTVPDTEAATPAEIAARANAGKKRRWEDTRVQWLGDKVDLPQESRLNINTDETSD